MRILLLLMIVFSSACFVPPKSDFSVKEMTVVPATLLVSKKIPAVAYIVLDPQKVPNTMSVLVQGKDNGGKVTDLQTFVSRDLVVALKNYFEDVQVVAVVPSVETPHVIVDLLISKIEVQITSRLIGQSQTISAGYAEMTWSIALRPNTSENYLFSFATKSAGNPTDKPDSILPSMFEGSVMGFLKGYSDKEVHNKFLMFFAPPKSAPPTPQL